MQAGRSIRRTAMKGRPGIYRRVAADGRAVFEIGYRDRDGRQRWQTVAGGLQDAVVAREEARGRVRRGERSAPSRVRFADLAGEWIAGQTAVLRPRSLRSYRGGLRCHVLPRLGHLFVDQIREDDVATLVAELTAQGLAGATVANVLVPVGRILDQAVRRGLISSNPVRRIERHERPRVVHREMRVLGREEIAALLDAAEEPYRTLFATGIFTGLRIGEVLGLTWVDLDLQAELVHVRRQISQDGVPGPLKTVKARRSVVLMPTLGRLLREHRLRSARSLDCEPVFGKRDGRPLRYATCRYQLRRAAFQAGLSENPEQPRLRLHDLRHTFASLLIAQGANVVFVSRQLGHASPNTTLGVYAHLFDRAEHAKRTSDLLEANFAHMLAGP
jgi:integrase